jgi:hypothetical protein
MLEFPLCKGDASALKYVKTGGERNDLSKMQRADGERVETGALARSRGAPLYQLWAGSRSIDCTKSPNPVAYEAAGSDCGLGLKVRCELLSQSDLGKEPPN